MILTDAVAPLGVWHLVLHAAILLKGTPLSPALLEFILLGRGHPLSVNSVPHSTSAEFK